MGFYYNLASTSTSIAMIGALLSFAGVGLLILIFSEGLFHGLSKLFYFFGNQILISRRLFSKKNIDENKDSTNLLYINDINKTEIKEKDVSLAEQKEWLEKILKMKIN
tara:strand:+ start:290 stop:613 length:324 start_codon:yes stop_codon:yes gene_type:complete